MKRSARLFISIIVLNGLCQAAESSWDGDQLLNQMDQFLIRQMEVFNAVRPSGQPPLVQTIGWDTSLAFPPAELNPPPCPTRPCAGAPLPESAWRGDIYDQSLAAIWFTERARLAYTQHRDGRADFRRAQDLLGAIIFLAAHDPLSDGRVRTAYWANNLLNPAGTAASILDPSTGVGNICYFGIALTRFCYAAQQTRYLGPVEIERYLQVAREKADWLIANCVDNRGQGGFTGGYEGWGQTPFMWKSTEHNIDAYVFARNLYALDRAEKWAAMADHAQRFVQSMYVAVNRTRGYYLTGTQDDGVTPNRSPLPADAQAWTALASAKTPGLDTTKRTKAAMTWLVDPRSGLLATWDASGSNACQGLRFSREGKNIQVEVSASAAMALWVQNRRKDADGLFECLESISQDASPAYDGIDDGVGIVATPSPEGAWTGYGPEAWYYNLLHTASSAWTGLAVLVAQGDSMANPLLPLPSKGRSSR